MYFCILKNSCIAAVRLPDGTVQPAATSEEGSLCENCRRRTIPTAATVKPEGNGQPEEKFFAADDISDLMMRDGRKVRVNEHGLPVDILEGSPFSLLPERQTDTAVAVEPAMDENSVLANRDRQALLDHMAADMQAAAVNN